jgi:predicted RecB family nuclease
MRFGKENIGSSSLTEFLGSKEIDCVICGHSHLNGGKTEKYNKTCVFNVSSHDDQFAPGNILFLRINKLKINFQFRQIKYFQKIKSDLSILWNVGPTTYNRMIEKGITKLEDINEGNRSLLKTIPGVYNAHVDYWLMQIKAIKQDKVHIIENELTEILQKNEIICYDIETNLENDRIWLIGYYNFQTNEFGSIFEKDNELNCLKRLSEYLKKYNNFKLISFSNCKFENRIITQRAEYYNLMELLPIIKNEIDLGINIPYILIGNIGKYNLKDLGNYFGFRWESPDVDGMEVGSAYSQYLKTKKEIDWEKYIKYNKDDVFALKEIIMRVRELIKTKANQTQS